MIPLWTSTLGFTAYNLIALSGSLSLANIVSGVLGVHSVEAPEQSQIEAAVAGMVSRGWVDVSGSDYSLKDSQRRLVKWRARTSEGWDGWKVDDPDAGPLPIEQVTS
jgi:hypothetical protein